MSELFVYTPIEPVELSKHIAETGQQEGIVVMDKIIVCPKICIIEGSTIVPETETDPSFKELIKVFMYGKAWSEKFDDLFMDFLSSKTTRAFIPQLSLKFKDGDHKKLTLYKDNKLKHQWETNESSNGNLIVTIHTEGG